MGMDWKEALAAMKNEVPQVQEETDSSTSTSEVKSEEKPKQKGKLHFALEKKGRGGKTATIIYGFELPDNEIEDVARRLKQRLGIGGSARGGEILLQGDCREKAQAILKELGFK